MQLDFLFKPTRPVEQPQHALNIGARTVPIHFVRNPRSRRYIIRLRSDGSIRATVPSRGSIKEARALAERNTEWITLQLQKQQQEPVRPHVWRHGTEILYRGQTVALHIGPNHDGNRTTFGDQSVRVTNYNQCATSR